jgi:hypothetical protein
MEVTYGAWGTERVVQRQASTAATLRNDQITLSSQLLQQGNNTPLLQSHDGGPFVREDRFVGVDADEERGAQTAGLEHGAGVA